MNLPPSLRARGIKPAVIAQPAKPAQVSADVAAARLVICLDCQNYSLGDCKLFGCCNRSVMDKVTWALAQCPAIPPKWERILPV